MPKKREAVVIGAGPNGLVAANCSLTPAGTSSCWRLKQAVGGAVQSAEDVADGFVHDTFSSFYPMAAVSPVIKKLRLEQHGLSWRRAPAVLGHPLPDGDWALLHSDVEATAQALESVSAPDGPAWRELCGDWRRIGPAITDALLSPFPPVRSRPQDAHQTARSRRTAVSAHFAGAGAHTRLGPFHRSPRAAADRRKCHAQRHPAVGAGFGDAGTLADDDRSAPGISGARGWRWGAFCGPRSSLRALGGQIRCGVRVDGVLSTGARRAVW